MELTLAEADLPLQCMYRWERERSDRVFLTQPFGGGKVREWTWAQAAADVRRMAAYLRARGWEPGSRVAILSKNCAWWILADLAVWMAGHVTVPIYYSLKPLSVRRILEHSECRGCFFGPTEDPEVSRLGIPAGVHRIAFPNAAGGDSTVNWDDVIWTVEPISGNPTRSAEDLATIIYTSGTTGAPKGVMHRFGTLAADALALKEVVHATSEDRFISYLPLAHIVERCGLEATSVLIGAHIFFVEGIDTFVTDLKRAAPTIFLSVPRLLVKFQQGVYQKMPKEKLERLLRVPIVRGIVRNKVLTGLGLSSVRLAACGAAPLPPDVLLWYRRLGLPLLEGYGMTETTVTHVPQVDAVRPGCVGPAVKGVETRIADTGELLVRSPMNMAGYYRDPEGTQAAFDLDGFFHTGDLVTMDSDGQIRIVGRIKDQFKTSKGKYVAPAPIESRLSEHYAVESCCLMGAGLPSPFALILLHPEIQDRCRDPKVRAELEESLERQLTRVNEELETHERVAFLAIVSGPWTIGNGMITPTFKIRRSNIESRYLEQIDGWRSQNRRVIWDVIEAKTTSQAS
jgi:long-chain acyl-CoA synthetase